MVQTAIVTRIRPVWIFHRAVAVEAGMQPFQIIACRSGRLDRQRQGRYKSFFDVN
ncbi:MAG: hypothetical protein ACRD4Q_09925 [Candidatus Acidiferrales bacterium]